MSCPKPPIRINLATYDENLFNFATNTFAWAGVMYWHVQCLVDNHVSISNRLPSRIPKQDFLPFTTTPTQPWDFCKSTSCEHTTDTFLLTLTFRPGSTKFEDYIKFIFTQDGAIFDTPEHPLTDMNGREVRLDIAHVNFSRRYDIVELWFVSGAYQDVDLTPLLVDEPPNPTPQIESFMGASNNTLFIVGVVVFAVLIALFLLYLSFKSA